MAIERIMDYVINTFVVAGGMFIIITLIRKGYKSQVKNINEINRKEAALDLLIFYLLSLYQITAIRAGLSLSLEKLTSRNTRVNLEPFKLLWRWLLKGRWWLLFYNVAGNCIWFIPLGMLVPYLFQSKRKWWLVTGIGMLVSTSIEILQYILCTGVTDIDDIIFNALGTLIGYGMWKSGYSIKNRLFLKSRDI